MQLISVNVGQPRTLSWRGRAVSTGIFKSPVAGPVMARHHNLDGDRQADLTVHGGALVGGMATPPYDGHAASSPAAITQHSNL